MYHISFRSPMQIHSQTRRQSSQPIDLKTVSDAFQHDVYFGMQRNKNSTGFPFVLSLLNKAIFENSVKDFMDTIDLVKRDDINRLDDTGHGPLHYAALQKNNKSAFYAKSLLSVGADINLLSHTDKEDYRQTPLHIAAIYKNEDFIQAIIEASVNSPQLKREIYTAVNTSDINNKTPLHLAVESGNLNIIKMLVKAGASLSKLNGSGLSAYEIARQQRADGAITKFLQSSINRWDELGKTRLHYAIANGNTDRIEKLLRAGFTNINHVDRHGKKAVDYASSRNMINFLIRKGFISNQPRITQPPINQPGINQLVNSLPINRNLNLPIIIINQVPPSNSSGSSNIPPINNNNLLPQGVFQNTARTTTNPTLPREPMSPLTSFLVRNTRRSSAPERQSNQPVVNNGSRIPHLHSQLTNHINQENRGALSTQGGTDTRSLSTERQRELDELARAFNLPLTNPDVSASNNPNTSANNGPTYDEIFNILENMNFSPLKK